MDNSNSLPDADNCATDVRNPIDEANVIQDSYDYEGNLKLAVNGGESGFRLRDIKFNVTVRSIAILIY